MNLDDVIADLTVDRPTWTSDAAGTIVAARIEELGGRGHIWATVDDVERVVCSFYLDELMFTADEFVGLTLAEARTLHHDRDVAYPTS